MLWTPQDRRFGMPWRCLKMLQAHQRPCQTCCSAGIALQVWSRVIQVRLTVLQTPKLVELAAVPTACATLQRRSVLALMDGRERSVTCLVVLMIATTKVCALLEHAFVITPSLATLAILCAVLMTALATAFAWMVSVTVQMTGLGPVALRVNTGGTPL